MDYISLTQIVGILITGLLTIIAYFLRSIHTDFKSMKEELINIRITTSSLQATTEDRFSFNNEEHRVINNRLDFHSQKLSEQDKEITTLKSKIN